MPGYAPQAAFARSREAFAQAEGWLAGAGAAGLDHAALEEQLAARGREIQRLLLQDHLDARAAAEPRRAQVTGPDGITRRRAERGHTRPLSSVFGPVRVTRIAYRAPGAPQRAPGRCGAEPAGREAFARVVPSGRDSGCARVVRAGLRRYHPPERVRAGHAAVPAAGPGGGG